MKENDIPGLHPPEQHTPAHPGGTATTPSTPAVPPRRPILGTSPDPSRRHAGSALSRREPREGEIYRRTEQFLEQLSIDQSRHVFLCIRLDADTDRL